jgi:methylthioribose-1-phosphate isomerase
MQKNPNPPARSIEWIGDLDGFVRLIDQTQLPESLAYIEAQMCKRFGTRSNA